MPYRQIIAVTLAVALLCGCGRRGPLEPPGAIEPASSDAIASPTVPGPPPGASAPANSASAGVYSTLDPGSVGAQQPAAVSPVAAPPRRFFLDPLI